MTKLWCDTREDLTIVLDKALEETRRKMPVYWNKPRMDVVNFALGLYTGILMRIIDGDPDPDPRPEVQQRDVRD